MNIRLGNNGRYRAWYFHALQQFNFFYHQWKCGSSSTNCVVCVDAVDAQRNSAIARGEVPKHIGGEITAVRHDCDDKPEIRGGTQNRGEILTRVRLATSKYERMCA